MANAAKSKMKTPESKEKAKIKKYLGSIGAWHFSPYMAGFGKSGVPDIVCCYKGQFWAIEVKREGKPPTELQKRRMQEIERAGGVALWGTAEKVIRELAIIRI
jgi:Holliday junction resolvase